MDSILLIDKPKGITSAKAVALVKKRFKVKVGHTGTLDPLATGLLILLTGKRTKQASTFLHMDKAYQVRAILGITTTTYDVAGDVVKSCDRPVSREEMELALKGFVGELSQVPPAFSAKKIAGKKAYELARQGVEVDMPASKVTAYSLRLLTYDYPNFTLECEVSSGFYVRSLVHDLGERLGVGATVEEVRRIRVGAYRIEDAVTLETLLGEPVPLRSTTISAQL
ncbi:MAG: tRNA pseudouridine(55) synthase TruB [Dehalococcoidia bacterium]|jgi:tRNA pseudouridine55 synthase|nr:tRNA pseudouridine(55) synthase TruB [Dehalococcoidia bacterium]